MANVRGSAALERKQWMQPLPDEQIPTYTACNRPISDEGHAEGGALEPSAWQVAVRQLMEKTGIAPGPGRGAR